jgi:hypothetical protein
MTTFILNNYLEILLFAFTLGVSAAFIIFLWPFKTFLPEYFEVEDIFQVTQSGLYTLFTSFFISIVAAKLFSIPLITPFICLLPLSFFGLYRRIFVQGLGVQAAILGFISIVFFIALFQLGTFISKWDGAAHQTMVTKMMAGNSLLLGNTYRLDERLEGYAIQPYYPYLVHSIIASITEGFASIGMRAQQCFLALSVVLSFLSLSAVVVTANKYSNNRKVLYSFLILLFSLSVPATLFSEVHHGSFARAIATVFGIGIYAQMLGDFRGRTLFFKAAIIVLAFTIHLQGAIFVGALFLSEMICYGFDCGRKALFRFLIIVSISLLGIGIFLLNNTFYMGIVNHDAMHDLFEVWRIQVISSPYSWMTYSISNLFTSQGLLYGLIKFVLVVLGCAYLWKKYLRILTVLLVFILACFAYVGLLLYLPDGLFIELLATPFAGAISRVYEGISIAVLLLASVGMLRILNLRINSFRLRLVIFIVVAWVVAPSTLVQFHLAQLAKTFDTISSQELKEIELKVKESGKGKILIISEDNRYMALDNGSNIRSYLSYFDCPLPYDDSPECLNRLQFAKSLVAYIVNNRETTSEMNDGLNVLIQNGYENIYMLAKTEKNQVEGIAIYQYSFPNNIFLKSFKPDQ